MKTILLITAILISNLHAQIVVDEWILQCTRKPGLAPLDDPHNGNGTLSKAMDDNPNTKDRITVLTWGEDKKGNMVEKGWDSRGTNPVVILHACSVTIGSGMSALVPKSSPNEALMPSLKSYVVMVVVEGNPVIYYGASSDTTETFQKNLTGTPVARLVATLRWMGGVLHAEALVEKGKGVQFTSLDGIWVFKAVKRSTLEKP